MVKQRNDSCEAYKKAGRKELLENEMSEIAIRNEFLPKQLSEEEMKKICIEKIKEDKIEPDFVSALKLCKRRRIGPIRPVNNRELFYKKDMGILARGGFSFELSKRVLDLDADEFYKLIKII